MNRAELLAVAKPILFNTPMVQAILGGRKTETRRVVKPRYRDDEIGFNVVTNAHDGSFVRVEKYDEYESSFDEKGGERIVNPPYNVGDILYVRETWAKLEIKRAIGYTSKRYVYRASDTYPFGEKYIVKFRWHPSIHMPKEAARIFMKVTGVRVERLQDISAEECMSEGVSEPTDENDRRTAIGAFADLWNSAISKKNRALYGWYANPWVWVVEFERVEAQE